MSRPIVLALSLLILAAPAYVAAECTSADIDRAARGADLVFEATVTGLLDMTNGESVATLQVHRVWRGSIRQISMVHFHTQSAQGPIVRTGRYVMFAGRQTLDQRTAAGLSPDAPYRNQWLPPCGAFRVTDAAALKAIEELGASREPAPGVMNAAGTAVTLTFTRQQGYPASVRRVSVTASAGYGMLSVAWGLGPEGIGPPSAGAASRSRELTESESDDLRRLFDEARLFDGGYVGVDATASDAFFDTLRVTQRRTAVLVTSGNPTFDSGPRKALVEWLLQQESAMRKLRR